MTKKRRCNDYFCDAVPEIDQHEVRYSEYTLKMSKNPKLPEKRQYLEYGDGPIIDSEIDEDNAQPDYSSYILPTIYTTSIHQKKKELKKERKQKIEMSLDLVYVTLHKMKLTKLRKIMSECKNEIQKSLKNQLSLNILNIARRLYSTMFNPDQKFCIYIHGRQILNIPKHQFREVPYLYTCIAPDIALMVFQKQFKIDTKINAAGKLAALELLNPSFYTNKSDMNLYCRT